MKYELTHHAKDVLAEREIPKSWIERVLDVPEKIERDSSDPELEHRLARIKEYQNRVLRVIINKDSLPIKIVTVYFDRNMRNRL